MRALTLSLASVVALTLSLGCTKSGDTPPPGSPGAPGAPGAPAGAPTGAPAADPAAPAPIPPRIEGPVGDVLEAYESARAKLAADDLPGAQPFATSLAAAARTASEHAVSTKQQWTDIATAADKMVATKDIGEARLAFGDVSKNVITLMSADPELRTGRFLFLCPMAKGYQKWVQTTPKLNNPYWGKEMLECGEELKAWAP